MSEHKFKIGELVNYLSRGGSLGEGAIVGGFNFRGRRGRSHHQRLKSSAARHESRKTLRELRLARP
jgi:hypothetical protein